MAAVKVQRIMKEIVDVVRLKLQECAQSTVKQGVDVPVPQIQERLVVVGKERHCERLGAERGDHVHQSGDRVREQVLCHASTSRRVMAPASNEVTEVALLVAIRSFGAGVSRGPTGQRPDFYKQLVVKGDKPAVPLLLGLSHLLAAGRAPAELPTFIGRRKGTALRKKAKDASDDARPARSGKTIRRIIGKALLATDREPQ